MWTNISASDKQSGCQLSFSIGILENVSVKHQLCIFFHLLNGGILFCFALQRVLQKLHLFALIVMVLGKSHLCASRVKTRYRSTLPLSLWACAVHTKSLWNSLNIRRETFPTNSANRWSSSPAIMPASGMCMLSKLPKSAYRWKQWGVRIIFADRTIVF